MTFPRASTLGLLILFTLIVGTIPVGYSSTTNDQTNDHTMVSRSAETTTLGERQNKKHKIVQDGQIDQVDDPVKSSTLLHGAIEILDNRWDAEQLNLTFHTLQTNEVTYYGQAGGFAGLGSIFLDTIEENSTLLTTDLKNQMLTTAQQIGQQLNKTGYFNTTHANWTVHAESSIIDLSYDFGLAGIADFFVDLFNYTGVQGYLDIANRTLAYIYDVANYTNGLNFDSQLVGFVKDPLHDWYPHTEFDYYTAGQRYRFNNIAFGTAGIAKVALNYLQNGNADEPMVETLLNESIRWIDNQLEVNGSSLTMPTNMDDSNIYATGRATGVSGIAELYVDLADFTGNNTFLDVSKKIADWLLGASSSQPLYDQSFLYAGNLEPYFELGSAHGITGVASFLMDLAEKTDNTTLFTSAKAATSALFLYEKDEATGLSYPERFINNQPLSESSTSWAYGTGGIFSHIYDAGEFFKDDTFRSKAKQMKRFLRTRVVTDGQFQAIYAERTGQLENNPSYGMPGTLQYLPKLISGSLEISTQSLDFGKTAIGTVVTEDILLSNTGERPLNVFWTGLNALDTFGSDTFSTTIGELGIESLSVEFNPEAEQIYRESFLISSIDGDYNVTVAGEGFDLPDITVIEGIAEDTTISDDDPRYFELEVTDSSEITDVTLSIDDTTIDLASILGTDRYNTTWTPNLANGTYTLSYQATDIAGNIEQISYTVTIAIHTPGAVEQIFSPTTMYIMLGIGAVALVTIIVFWRRYVN